MEDKKMFELIPFDHRMRRVANYDPFREWEAFFGDSNKLAVPFNTDVIDNGDAFVLNADMPGFRKEDIKLDIEDDCLTISAERKAETNDEKPNFIKRERFYGSFKRSFDLSGIDVDKIEASYNDGVLSLNMPKIVEVPAATRSIAIK